MAYPTREPKGFYFSVFWIVFNLGATLGGLVTFATCIRCQHRHNVQRNDGTFVKSLQPSIPVHTDHGSLACQYPEMPPPKPNPGASALSQILIISLTCFCCPGLFNALSSVASGIADPSIAYNGTSILYAFFAIFGLVAGGLVNVLGPKYTLFIGTWGYVLYTGSLLYMEHNKMLTVDPKDANKTLTTYSMLARMLYYVACGVLGMAAGLVWTAQGQMCMAYPTQETKGIYFSVFWIIFNLGATIGGIITFATNYNSNASGASTGTYVAFLIMMSMGACLSLLLAKPEHVQRNDGTFVQVCKLPDWRTEALASLKVFVDPKMLLLLPLFAYSNWFYTYHSFYNVGLFNARSGGLGSVFYWGAQMVGAYTFGQYLDKPGVSRRTRALKSLGMLFVLTSTMWGLGLWAQVSYGIPLPQHHKFDFKDIEYWVPFLLYGYYGLCDAICQMWSYWLMGQISDDIKVLGLYSGYYKAVQSAMGATSWQIGASQVDPVTQLLINWVLSVVGMAGAYISIRVYVYEYSYATDHEYDMSISPSKVAV
ncbi:TPA: hypothetical protein N0F65_006722 [Lagenidium giganteum]|uniref:Uncharacterized protein n=1 Tax=Lagenidium giganteum TaxID=4803 RepID=A0AAV2Z7J4_9STRA|nr:TPA: hypothetical protein N0F65_006722 [Lagenidium giganteum]